MARHRQFRSNEELEKETYDLLRYKSDKDFVDECVQIYLATSDSMLAQARGRATGFDGINNEEATQQARRAWSAMSRARLFCIRPEHWLAMYRAADRYTTSLAGLEWRQARSKIRLSTEDVTLDLSTIWGVDQKEAYARGYVEHAVVNGLKSFVVTNFGRKALEEGLHKLPPKKRAAFHHFMDEAEERQTRGDFTGAARALENVEKVMFDETEEDIEQLLNVYEEVGVHWAFPDPMPFDSCFFCIGRKVNLSLSPATLHTRFRMDEFIRMGEPDIYLLGYLVSWEGDTPCAYGVMQFGKGDGFGGVGDPNASVIGVSKVYFDDEWFQPRSLDPWIVTMIVKSINEHKQIVTNYSPNLTNRMDKKKAEKKSKAILPLPAPFYMVNLQDELITAPRKAPTQLPARPVEWSHRWDVRGHECCRIERGELPIDPKLKASLKRREYRIYEGMAVLPEDLMRLEKRGIRAPGPREWVAVLSFWREAAVKGPVDKPYIPAARVDL